MLTVRTTFQGCQTDGICYPPMTRTATVTLPAGEGAAAPADAPRETPPARAPTALWLALLLALGGGVILNLMPCVLPVLSLKALSLAQGGGQAKRQALWYTAGVLASFAAVGAIALALRQAGLALGWGFQLQQPLVVALLGLVVFAFGLSLSGLWYANIGIGQRGSALVQRDGVSGDFFTGVLAVVVASPCTAPFMGVALAYAFTAPTPLALLVFAMLGLGLALPFLLIGFVPALANRLPRPGAWMDTLKQVLAFPMYLTAVWLLWVLAKQRGADAIGLALVGAVGLGLGLWLWEKARWKGVLAKGIAVAIILAALWPAVLVQRMPAPEKAAAAEAGVVAYSADSLEQLRRDGRVVFVNMTADWCVSCKANERTVLSRDDFRAALDVLEQAMTEQRADLLVPLIEQARALQRRSGFSQFPASGQGARVLQQIAPAASLPFQDVAMSPTEALPPDLRFPAFAKPVKGVFSVLARRVDNAAELQRHLALSRAEFETAEQDLILRVAQAYITDSVEPGSREAQLTDVFTRPQNWLGDSNLAERCAPHHAVA